MAENVNATVPTAFSQLGNLKNVTFTTMESGGINVPFAYRKADLPIFKAVFEAEEHSIPVENFKPKLILDCGGNIGCTALYYALKYPDAKIYSIEPEK